MPSDSNTPNSQDGSEWARLSVIETKMDVTTKSTDKLEGQIGELAKQTALLQKNIQTVANKLNLCVGVVAVIGFLFTGSITWVFDEARRASDSARTAKKEVEDALPKIKVARDESLTAISNRRAEIQAQLTASVVDEVKKQASQMFSVGTVIAYAGALDDRRRKDLLKDGWVVCDGQCYDVSTAEYRDMKDLRLLLLKLYDGPKTTETTFYVPDYRGVFLRGLDGRDDGTVVIDKDRATRLSMFLRNEIGNRVGSWQGFSTSLPVAKAFETSDAGVHVHNQSVQDESGHGPTKLPQYADARGTRTSGANTSEAGAHRHVVSSGGDLETRPVNVAVHWLIRFR